MGLTATVEEGIAVFVAIGTAIVWPLSVVTCDRSVSVSMYCVYWQNFWDLACYPL